MTFAFIQAETQHSDRGCHYTSAVDQRALVSRGVHCSMSRRGNCYDNAVVESFFRTLKLDLELPTTLTRAAAAARIGRYIEGFCNTRRLHSTLNCSSPAQFERDHRRVA